MAVMSDSKMQVENMSQSALVHTGGGCVFIPTFRDTHLLEENFCGRPELLVPGLDYYVYDDNPDPRENARIKELCQANGFIYRHSGRGPHGDFCQEINDRSTYNHFIWNTFTTLGQQYDFVLKIDTDALIIAPDWQAEYAQLLAGQRAFAGTPEYRAHRETHPYWDFVKQFGYARPPWNLIPHA